MRRISPGDSLSKITGNAEPLSEQLQNISRLTASTVQQHANLRNRKLRLGCVKTVESENFLWKRTEN
jgi:hypothetical protein